MIFRATINYTTTDRKHLDASGLHKMLSWSHPDEVLTQLTQLTFGWSVVNGFPKRPVRASDLPTVHIILTFQFLNKPSSLLIIYFWTLIHLWYDDNLLEMKNDRPSIEYQHSKKWKITVYCFFFAVRSIQIVLESNTMKYQVCKICTWL